MSGAKPPSWLDAQGKAYWRKLVKILPPTAQDDELLAMMADAYSTYRQATKELKETGLTYVSSSGIPKAHPLVAIKKSALDQIRQLAKQLLKDVEYEQDEDDPLTEIFGGNE